MSLFIEMFDPFPLVSFNCVGCVNSNTSERVLFLYVHPYSCNIVRLYTAFVGRLGKDINPTFLVLFHALESKLV